MLEWQTGTCMHYMLYTESTQEGRREGERREKGGRKEGEGRVKGGRKEGEGRVKGG